MQQSVRNFLDDFLVFVGEAEDPDARQVATLTLNISLTAIWLQHHWSAFRSPVPFQVTLAAGQARYALPPYLGRIWPDRIPNLTRGGRVVPLQPGAATDLYPAFGTTAESRGHPSHWDVSGVCGVFRQPAVTGEALEVVSTSTSDTGVVVSLAGDNLDGDWTRHQVTLTGTAPVAVGVWTFVDEFGKAYPETLTPPADPRTSVGTVTLRTVSGGTVLQRLLPADSSLEHKILTIYPTPNVTDTLAVPFLRTLKRVYQPSDPLPEHWAPALWEEMVIAWKVNSGELSATAAATTPRPKLAALVAYENTLTPRHVTRPFVGLR